MYLLPSFEHCAGRIFFPSFFALVLSRPVLVLDVFQSVPNSLLLRSSYRSEHGSRGAAEAGFTIRVVGCSL